MDFSTVNSFEDMLLQLPPEMSNLIRAVLMEPKIPSQNQIYDSSKEYINSVIEDPTIIIPHINPLINSLPAFIIVCVLICLLINLLTGSFYEYIVSKRPILKNKSYSPIGTYILSYCHNYEAIKPGKIRDDIDDIYERCLKRYDKNSILNQREEEIIEDRKTAKIKRKLYVTIFLVLFLFFFVFVGMGGVYIGLELKGLIAMCIVTYAAKKIYPFIFSSKSTSYELLQVKEYRNIIENYELEKIKYLKK
jgi:hypothetical protein